MLRLLAPIAILLASVIGCSSIEKAKPRPESARVSESVKLDVPQIMRGTIASEVIVMGHDNPSSRNYRPIITRGYGLVVGLNGTGSRDIPPQVRAHMLTEAAKGGWGSRRFGEEIGEISPEELLSSPDVAVVIVEAVIPQGAPEGTKFDVRVYPQPNSGTTSLEGGTLYTTDLRPGPLTTGGGQAAALAKARGPVFVNPFAEPDAVGKDTVNRTVGRILNGGEVTKDMPLKLRLLNPSHTRASIIETAINTRFPQEVGHFQGDPRHQTSPTAHGESDESIELTVPPSFKDRTDDFIELIRHTTIAQSNPEAVAMSIRRALLANPALANDASWRWQALGNRILPLLKDLYDHPEELPRLAALRAGARLNDPLVISQLTDMAANGSADYRIQAIQLLAEMNLNPQIDVALRKLLDDDDVEIRLEAYEALGERRDPYMRRTVVDSKFLVDVVNSTKPLIYITQIGEPRIVLFGPDLAIERPATVSAWSNRFMIKADKEEELVEVYYREPDAEQGVILRIEPDLETFVHFLGHTTTIEHPAPGLGLTYAQTVGAIHQIWSQKYINAAFRAEQDRILAAIMRLQTEDVVTERPEFTENEAPATDGGANPVAADQPGNNLGRLDGPNQILPPSNSTPPG
ncbi:MAG: flagellar basal body P-ring protein FlgI [Phycisphaerales bacterium]|nr:flagellar basal body P-ring protein FlgI [Phycisphaerales bacterium]